MCPNCGSLNGRQQTTMRYINRSAWNVGGLVLRKTED